MRNLFIIMLVIVTLASCKEKTKKDFIEESFMNYVETDFDNPDDFIEITSIQAIDTLDNRAELKIASDMKAVSSLYTEENQKKLDEFIKQLQDDKTFIVTYELKVRIEKNGRKVLVKYYVLDDGLNYKVQDHTIQLEEAPQLYQDFLNFAKQGLVELMME